MNRYLVELYVPVIGKYYEIWVPEHITVGLMKSLFTRAVIDLSEAQYVDHENSLIMNQITGSIYNDELLVKDTDINNGTNLIMV